MKNKSVIAAAIGGLLAAAAGVFLYLNKDQKKKPPRRAPQVPVENPGEQSDFPAAPTSERDLG